ncbi:MAG TPA: peptide-methionine (S)-S-oxide reductase MsrA [Gaiellales bacterium]|jgi:peptide-methionine (S)-S-oxide reductase|nr:peptide-methionine (S)-S-oxide reductase MsrA [Gaiellales bacterium]
MNLFRTKHSSIPTADEALPGRDEPIPVPELHEVLGRPLLPPFPDGVDYLLVGMGCFWGAERIFWQTPGVWTTSVGYAGGHTRNPTYREVCSGKTGHAEVVLVAYETDKLSAADVLRIFWEGHDPTQGMRQGNDAGTQYRSAIYWRTPEQRDAAIATRDAYQTALTANGRGQITTEIAEAGPYYPAEDYHQQYLHKVPNGYCGIGGTGVSCPVGAGVTAA